MNHELVLRIVLVVLVPAGAAVLIGAFIGAGPVEVAIGAIVACGLVAWALSR